LAAAFRVSGDTSLYHGDLARVSNIFVEFRHSRNGDFSTAIKDSAVRQ